MAQENLGVEESGRKWEVIFSKRWEKFDNVYLRDMSKDVLVEGHVVNDKIVDQLKITINMDTVYIYKIFDLQELKKKLFFVKTYKQFIKLLAALIGE